VSATLVAEYSGQTKAATDTLTIANVVAADGDSIIFWVLNDTTIGAIGSVNWGAAAFSDGMTSISPSSSEMHCYVIHNVTGGTADVNVSAAVLATMAGVVQVWRGLKSSPTDQPKSNSSSSSSPTTNASATLAQANELQIAAIGTVGPDGDAAGTWGNSLTGTTRLGTTGGVANTNRTIATAYRILAATTAVTASKTGITFRAYGAMELTLKLADDITVTAGAPGAIAAGIPAPTVDSGGVTVTADPPGAASVGAPTPTVASGGITVSADAPGSAAVGAPAATTDMGGVSVTAGAPGVVAVGAPDAAGIVTYYDTNANGVLDPPTTLADGASSIAQSRGIRSFGLPYFAMWMQNPGAFTQFGGGENTLLLLAAINTMPTQILDPDEPHYLASIHEIGGVELFSIGVTPSGRLVARTYYGGTLQSAPGMVVPDGVARNYAFFFGGGSLRQLSIDSLIVAADDQSGITGAGPYSPTGIPVRVMIFNGVAARTLCDCTIFALGLSGENTPVVWPMTPIVGLTTPGYETDGSWVGEPIVPHVPPDYEGANFDLTAGFYDPRPLYPALAGTFPGGSVQGAFRRALNTQYRRRNVVTPDYRLVGST
jgi:hypothetical protein